MLGNEKSRTANFHTTYAQRADFCEVFENDMKSLYLLAFLLTANHKDAERCFVVTVDESFKQGSVFKNWTRTWIKRCLIRTAIRIVSPLSAGGSEKRGPWSVVQNPGARHGEIDAVTRLAPLERFVFVMSVLEGYSAWDCCLLLGVSTKMMESAKVRALRRLPDPAMFFVGAEASQSHRLHATA